MNEEKNLHNWIKEIAKPVEGFQTEFRDDPAATLRKRGFALHHGYEEMINDLSDDEKGKWAEKFVQVAKAESPSDLRELYSDWVDQYEVFLGWEELEEESPRGWA